MKTYCILFLFCFASCAMFQSQFIPHTKKEAIYELKTKWLSKKDLNWILMNPRDQVVARLHLPFGTSVRNTWKLWGGNPELMESCGATHPEECSSIIFQGLWESVRNDTDSVFVQRLDKQFALIGKIQIHYRGFDNNKIGSVIESLQHQIDAQVKDEDSLKIKVIGNPNFECFCRAEFSEDKRDPISLGLLLGWISWRNGFDVKNSPPYLEFVFRDSCSWSQKPNFKMWIPPTE